jgi:hypothetical protein
MLPHTAMMKELHRHKPKSTTAPRQKAAKAYRIIR